MFDNIRQIMEIERNVDQLFWWDETKEDDEELEWIDGHHGVGRGLYFVRVTQKGIPFFWFYPWLLYFICFQYYWKFIVSYIFFYIFLEKRIEFLEKIYNSMKRFSSKWKFFFLIISKILLLRHWWTMNGTLDIFLT